MKIKVNSEIGKLKAAMLIRRKRDYTVDSSKHEGSVMGQHSVAGKSIEEHQPQNN